MDNKEDNEIISDEVKNDNFNNSEKNEDKKQEKQEQELIDSDDSEGEESVDENDISPLEKAQEEIEQLRDEKLRLLAEMENLRKRSERERGDSVRYGCINLARDILSPDDNLTRALDAIPQEETNSDTINNLVDGLKMVQKEFSTVLEKYGVKKIDALNKKFDHNFHQAMVEIENNEVEHGTVVQEMQSGYTMHNRLLRPSMVGVSKKTEQNEQTKTKEIDEKEV